MIKRYSKRLSVIFIGVVFILSCFAIFSSIPTITHSYAQEKTAVDKDKVKAILLEQEKWIGEIDHPTYGPAEGDYVFEDRGKKMIVKIHSPSYKITCERKIKIKSNGFKMTGCNVGIAFMFYDPNDPIYPFKTKGDNLEYDLKLKAE